MSVRVCDNGTILVIADPVNLRSVGGGGYTRLNGTSNQWGTVTTDPYPDGAPMTKTRVIFTMPPDVAKRLLEVGFFFFDTST